MTTIKLPRSSDPIYTDPIGGRGMHGYRRTNRVIGSIVSTRTAGFILRRRFHLRGWGATHHAQAGAYWAERAARLGGHYNKLLNDAVHDLFGRPWEPGDTPISGIGNYRFPEQTKRRLRCLAQGQSVCKDISSAHYWVARYPGR